jgi:hypothetical protein
MSGRDRTGLYIWLQMKVMVEFTGLNQLIKPANAGYSVSISGVWLSLSLPIPWADPAMLC